MLTMNRADKAVLRLTLGLGLAVLVAYGFAFPILFVVCLMSILVLCKPGPPLPPAKGLVIAVIFAALVASGVLMVPILEHYAWSGILGSPLHPSLWMLTLWLMAVALWTGNGIFGT